MKKTIYNNSIMNEIWELSYEFTLDQVMQNGYLGHTTNEFQQFVSTAARAYKSKKPTNKIMWIK